MEPLASAPESPAESFPLRGGHGAIALRPEGLRHPRWPRWLGDTTTRFSDVTHHSVTSRGLRLGTRSSVYVFARGLFVDPSGPDELAGALVDRIAREPGGAAQLDRMFELEKLASRPRKARVAPALAALCAAVFVLQQIGFEGQRLFFAGLFSNSLVREGELWRLVTANLLHADPVHLALNALGLVAIGSLVERILGAARTGVVLAAGALGGMGAGLIARYEMALGASGIVFALIGALVFLELRWPTRVPATWRVPRVLLIGALAADAALSFGMPSIASAAHAGGFVAGALAAAAVSGPTLGLRRAPRWVFAADAAALFLLGASLSAAGAVFGGEGSPLARQGRVLAERHDADPLALNNLAWLIATDGSATSDDLALAVQLAERAVDGTARRDPNVLDTLAEALFAVGSAEGAVSAIDEAIQLAPGEAYFREQRRRFTGERAPGDRPDPPSIWIEPAPEEPAPLEPESPDFDDGVRI